MAERGYRWVQAEGYVRQKRTDQDIAREASRVPE